MAFRFGDSNDDLGDMAEINVTPLVDVMLVLLIIFMITAPMLTQGLEVALPQAEGKSFELASNNPGQDHDHVHRRGLCRRHRRRLAATSSLRSGRCCERGGVKRALLEADEGVPVRTRGRRARRDESRRRRAAGDGHAAS